MSGKALITNHALNAVIGQVLKFEKHEDFLHQRTLLSDVQLAGYDRIFLFARQLQEQLGRSDDTEVSLAGLTTIQSNLQNVHSELATFFQNDNPANLDNAIANLDGAISTSGWVFFRRPVRGSHLYGETVATVQESAARSIRALENQRDKLQEEIVDLQATLSSLDTNASTLNVSLKELTTEQAEAIESLQENYETFQADSDKRALDKLNELSTEFATKIDDKLSYTEESIKRILAFESQAKDIVQIVGNIGVTGNYQLRAQAEQRQANLWRYITIGLFALGVALVTINLLKNMATAIDLRTLVIRFAIAVAVTIPAIYTARESARHRSNADKAKQTELELASLSPFLETLPEDQRDKIIADLAVSYFGQTVDDHKVESPVDVNKLMDSVVTIASKIRPST